MSEGEHQPGVGMRDVAICRPERQPSEPAQVLDVLARVATGRGSGVGALLDAACELGARAALIRQPQSPQRGGEHVDGRGGGSADRGGQDPASRTVTEDALGSEPMERLELPLGDGSAARGTLVLVLPPGLTGARPDLGSAFVVLAGLLARELEPAPGSRRTPLRSVAATTGSTDPAAPLSTGREGGDAAAAAPPDIRATVEASAGGRTEDVGTDRRLQRLRETATALGRLGDEAEIYREVARQLDRTFPFLQLLIASPPHGGGDFTVDFAIDRGEEQPTGNAVQSDSVMAGVLATVALEGRPAHAVDDSDPAAPIIVGVPMLAGLRLIGVLAVRCAAPLPPANEEMMRAFGALAATALASAALYSESQRERRQTDALAEVARAVGASLRLNEVLRLILRHATALLRGEGAYVTLRSAEFLEIVAASDRAEILRGLYLPEDGSISGQVLRSRSVVVVNDADADEQLYRPMQRAVKARRMVVAPLMASEEVIGTLVVLNRATPFDDSDARVLARLADQVAVAIVNARLYEEVMESTREWTVAFDAIATGMLVLDARGRVLRCNASALALLGVDDVRQVIGRPFGTVLLHEPSAEMASLLDTALRERVVVRGTLRSRVRGLMFGIAASPHPYGGAVLTVDDVTTLHSLTERYRLVVETARDAIVISDMSRHIRFANPAAERLFGREGGVTGLPVMDLVVPEQREMVAEHQRTTLAGEPGNYQTVVVGAQGERRIVVVHTAPLRQLGDITGSVSTLRDITAEQRARDAIAASEARYRNLFESAADGICTMDRDGRITSVNSTLRRALGCSAAQLIGASACALVEPEDAPAAAHILERALEGERARGEIRYRNARGRVRMSSLIMSSIVEDGEVVGVLAMARDVTEERLLAAQLLQQEKLAAIGQLVSGVAHELNNPLAGIMAFSQLLLATSLDPEQHDGAVIINDEAVRAAKIVGNLLTFARQQEPQRSAVDLNELVRTIAQLRGYTLREQGVELVLDLHPALPRTWADEHQLHQVVLNLMTNAEQAMENRPQPRRLTVATAHHDQFLEVRVSDTGAGMDAAQLDSVFNPFFTTKDVGRGTGLGLSIAHGIVREHGGELTVRSELGVGTTFLVSLPVESAPQAPAPPAVDVLAGDGSVHSEPRGDTVAAGPQRRQRTVLVVDDEASIRIALRRYLERVGFAVETVAGGRDALATLAVKRFDAILLDLRMPDLAGDALFEMLRESDAEQAARIVFVTGDLRSDLARDFLASTGQPSVGKPFTFDELRGALEEVLGQL